jgi:predicted Zn-dependent peptidase
MALPLLPPNWRTQDGPVVLVDCLPQRLEAVWELFSRCLTDPMFDRVAYQDLRAGQIAAQKELETDPIPQALEAALLTAWPDRPIQGAMKTADLEAVALTTAQATFRDLMRQRCNLHLTTIGPIDAEKITELLSVTVEALPEGVCSESEVTSDLPILQAAKLVQSKAGSEGLVGLFPGPSPHSIQSLPMRLVMHLLEKRLRDQLIQHDHVAQRVVSDYVGNDPGYNLIQISGNNAYQCAEFTLSELRKLKTYGFNETEVTHGLRAIQAEIALGYESAPSLAARLDGAAADNLLPMTGNEAQLLKAANSKSLSALLRQYLTGISWGIVGDTAGIDRKSLQRL